MLNISDAYVLVYAIQDIAFRMSVYHIEHVIIRIYADLGFRTEMLLVCDLFNFLKIIKHAASLL